jgi:hypothetical protein
MLQCHSAYELNKNKELRIHFTTERHGICLWLCFILYLFCPREILFPVLTHFPAEFLSAFGKPITFSSARMSPYVPVTKVGKYNATGCALISQLSSGTNRRTSRGSLRYNSARTEKGVNRSGRMYSVGVRTRLKIVIVILNIPLVLMLIYW